MVNQCLADVLGCEPMCNFYAVLGVQFTADTADIRSAYRRLAKAYHPDRHRGEVNATARFQTIQQAYEVLSDQEQRRMYDIGLVDSLNVEEYLTAFKEMTLTVSGLGIAWVTDTPRQSTTHVCRLQQPKALQMLTA